MEMHPAYAIIDPYLIWFYRISGNGFVDFLLGTFVLAFITVIIGELTISGLFFINKKYIDRINGELARYQDLTMRALTSGDKPAYEAVNKLANDAFGKVFFMRVALSAGTLWPIFFALAWMGHRFGDLEFNLLFTDYSLSYIGMFVVLYAAAYLIFKRVKYRLPYFRYVKTVLGTYTEEALPIAGHGQPPAARQNAASN